VGKKARSNFSELPNTMFMVVIRWVSNGKDLALAPKQLQASYTDVRHWEQLIDFINKNRGPKEPYIMTSMFKCTLEQDGLDAEYMGLYKWADDCGPHIWPDFVQLLPFKGFEVETLTQSENIFG
jgi:hypothetical protein